jgi:hypothetical protein
MSSLHTTTQITHVSSPKKFIVTPQGGILNWEASCGAQPGGACCLERARFDLDISIESVYSATPAAPKAYAVVVLCALSQALKRGILHA